MFTLICARINGWVNNREADDLRRYRTHYDVIVMATSYLGNIYSWPPSSSVTRSKAESVQNPDPECALGSHGGPSTSGLLVAARFLYTYRNHIIDHWKKNSLNVLIHLTLVPHINVGELGQHGFKQWLVASSASSHYMIQCWLIVDWTLRNQLRWNIYHNSNISIEENAFENVVFNFPAKWSRGDMLRKRYSDVVMDINGPYLT